MKRVKRTKVVSNDGKLVSGYRLNGCITYQEPDGSWTVEAGEPDEAPRAPKLLGTGLTLPAAKQMLREQS